MELWSTEISYKIIKEYVDGKPMLVHCAAGMQRSAASVAFMLIAFNKMRGLEAMNFIKERRRVAFYPRAKFGRSIDYFDRKYNGEIVPQMAKIKLH